MRRLFIIRKDLHLSSGKLAAMVGHCAEAYWTNWIKKNSDLDGHIEGWIDESIYNDYINGIFTKTICEARNKNHLLKAKEHAIELGLIEGVDYFIIRDSCKTELTPEKYDENCNGTTVVGIAFRPLSDDIAHEISKKYHLYM